MNDTLRNDPILRAILVIFIGLLVFGFLFSFNFGGTGGGASAGHHGMAQGAMGGTSLFGGLITSLVVFSVKILTLILVFALIAGVIVGVRKFLSQQDGWAKASPTVEAINKDPLLKTILLVVVGIIAFHFITGLFNSFGFINMGAYMYTPYYGLLVLLGFLIKLLMIVFLVSVVIALVQYIKAQILDNKPQEVTYEAPSQFSATQPTGRDPNEDTLT